MEKTGTPKTSPNSPPLKEPPSITVSTEISSLLSEEGKRRGLPEDQLLNEALAAYFKGELSEEEKYRQDYYRREVAHEFNLLNQRLTWYVTCLSLLITSI